MRDLSRRELTTALAGAGLVLALARPALAQSRTLTAGEVVERIKANLGIPWNPKTYRDTFKIGGPDTPVRGICTTFGTNWRVMQLADKAGLNMIIPHEPTFWSDADQVELVKDDAIYKMKVDFAQKHNMVVWRIHDHWHAKKPDGIRTGFIAAMGWERYKDPANIDRFTLPATTLGALSRYLGKTLATRSVRVIGDPNLLVVRVGYGSHSLTGNMATLPSVDCMIVSEAREYDSFEYARDTVASGQKKGVIFISHVSGEDEGMNEFARWIRPFVPEVPIRYIPTTDEFWTV